MGLGVISCLVTVDFSQNIVVRGRAGARHVNHLRVRSLHHNINLVTTMTALAVVAAVPIVAGPAVEAILTLILSINHFISEGENKFYNNISSYFSFKIK